MQLSGEMQAETYHTVTSSTCLIEVVETRAQGVWVLSLRIYYLLLLPMFWVI